MDDLDDELDLRYHRGVKPDVYYRVPTSESLDGALRNELERNASTLIPSDIVTEFVFAAASTVTVPVTQQANLDALIEPQDYAQSIQVEYALCREFNSKDRLKIQRAVSKSIVAAIEEADGFKYSERRAYNSKTGGDGARLNYVCQDSLQNKDRKANKKKETDAEDGDSDGATNRDTIPTYDCGGAIRVKFSIKRGAINVVYKHNPIHRDVDIPLTSHSVSAVPQANGGATPKAAKAPNGSVKKRKRSKKDPDVGINDELHDPDLDMSTSPDASKSSAKKKRKSKDTATFAAGSSKPKKSAAREPSPPLSLAKNKACIRCREEKIKCDEAKPVCNQCKRGLWTCQYEVAGTKQRSKNGCVSCKQRRRKCTEEKPYCAYCLKKNDNCEYADYS
ncbi:uncharacterized protein M421DRAFT_101765 [Didymella exigua CBS 183.55]|uniref:Zn(2)-C6 fungal-type domain-containing protein n=1 Tax=Didymella exigua CBS 183.55 TaxID=1150837 RepID=A0A6A5RPB4_9PLEO|nr:uncharacterized protein M421DRAFT_101765 [Didymella exigua CBS 183.55]KAF1927347.1 hypothetical protein M421DRAFT_101765 [Didymella exigua CBS 183.55]